MNFRTLSKAPALAVAAVLGVAAFSGEAVAQQQQEQSQAQQGQSEAQQAQMCRAVLSPSTLTAPSDRAPEQERQRRMAGKMTLQARLSGDIGKVTDIEVEEGSNIQISLAEKEQKEDEARGQDEEIRLQERTMERPREREEGEQPEYQREESEETEAQEPRHAQQQQEEREAQRPEQHEHEMEHEAEKAEQHEQEHPLAEERSQQRRAGMSEALGQDRVPVEVDVSEAEEGEWTVTFVGENDQQCTATLRVRDAGPGR